MGCNSHTYIEYRRKGAKDGDQWASLLWSEVDNRNYALYAKMAGVCNYDNRIEPIASPRGFPDNAGSEARHKYYCYYIDNERAKKDLEHYVSSDKAFEWVISGISVLYPDDNYRISDPDVHTPSWLTAEEFCTAVREAASDDLYWTAVAAMVEHVQNTGDYDCRFVFWFDN